MLGPRKHAIKLNTTCSRPDPVGATLHKIDFLKSFMKVYTGAELSADVMHVNDVPFLTTSSDNVHCGNIYALENLKC